MATSASNTGFQSWLLDRMVEFGFTPMSLARGLGVLDGLVEDWVAGRALPSSSDCQKIAQLFEVPVRDVRLAAGLRSS
jgi:hypothetical protein